MGLIALIQQHAKSCGLKAIACVGLAFGFSAQAHSSVACSTVFPDGASTGSAGSVIFGANTRIEYSPDNVLATASIVDNGTTSCTNGDCTASGTGVDQVQAPTFNGGSNISVGNSASTSISPGHYGSVNLGQSSYLNLSSPGAYYFNGALTMAQSAQIQILSDGDYFIFFNGNANTGVSSGLNRFTNFERTLFIYATGDIYLEDNTAAIRTILYSGGSTTLDSGATVSGAVSATGNITLNPSYAIIYFDSSTTSGAGLDSGTLSCGAAAPDPSDLRHQWRFDENAWTGASQEVTDDGPENVPLNTVVVSSNLPTTEDSAPALSGNPGTCRYGDFDTDDGYLTVNDPGTNSALDFVNDFSVSFWFRSESIPSNAVSILYRNSFYIDINPDRSINVWLRLNGSWQQSRSVANVWSQNAWTHLAFTHTDSSQTIYINGSAVHTSIFAGNLTDGTDPIYIGNSGYTGEYFNGQLDEMAVYTGVLSSGEVSALATERHACPFTDPSGDLNGEWRFDEFGWNGTPNEVVDSSGAGNPLSGVVQNQYANTANSTPVNGGDPGTCHYAQFDGSSDGHIESASSTALDFSGDFSLAFWFKVDQMPSGWYSVMRKDANFAIDLNTNREISVWFFPNYGWQSISTGSNVWSVGAWHHMAFTHVDGRQAIYIDGVLQATSSHAGNVPTVASPLRVGYLSDNNEYFRGAVDELRTYERELSSAQVSTIMSETRSCPPYVPEAASLMAEWRFDETSWDGTASEIIDSSGANYHGTAQAGLTTNNTSPALNGADGTCGYGSFDGVDDVAEIPGFPNLTSSHSVTFWMRSTNLNDSGRLIADDDNDGGFLLSYGEGGAGSFRHVFRNPLNAHNTNTGLVSGNTWHHIALVVDDVLKTRQIYVDGTLVNFASGPTTVSHSASIAADAGLFTIGSESTAAAEYPNVFTGDIDEVRVYSGVLSSAQVNTIMGETRTCPVQDLEETLVANWQFDEIAGDYDGTAGELLDSSSNALHGTAVLEGSGYPSNDLATPALSGDPGTCRYGTFDFENDGYMSIPDPGADSPLDIQDAYSIALWVRFNNLDGFQYLVNKDNFQLRVQSNDVIRFMFNNNSSQILGSSSVTTGTWYHIVATFRNGEQKLYINGVEAGSSSITATETVNNNAITLGGIANNTNRNLDGDLDEVQLYSAALTPTQVNELYAARHNCPAESGTATLLAEWRFDEPSWSGTNGEVTDSSGNNYHGTAIAGLTTDDTSPAQSGSIGTCRYGSFDGNTDVVEVAGFPNLTTSNTVTFWMRPAALTMASGRIIADDDNNDGWYISHNVNSAFGNLRHGKRSDGASFETATTGVFMSEDVWYHVAITNNTATKTRQIYIDGVLTAWDDSNTTNTYINTMDEDAGLLALGNESSSGNEYLMGFEGDLDEIRIYDGILSASEITGVMNDTRLCPVLDPADNLVAEWRFDDESWSGVVGEVTDSGPNALHGTAFDSGIDFPEVTDTTPVVAGDPGTCQYGEFSGATDSHIAITDPGADSAIDLTDAFTLAAWIRPASLPSGTGRRGIITKSGNYYLSYAGDGSVHFAWRHLSDSSWERVYSSTGYIAAGTWAHIAASYSSAGISIFVNGVEVYQSGSTPAPVLVNDVLLEFGDGVGNGEPDEYSGSIDEVRIYNRALSTSEISTIKDETRSCKTVEESLVVRYAFEEFVYDGVADEVIDSGTNSLHGQAYDDSTGSLPTTEDASPALAGNPGSCRYLKLDSTDDGYIEIADPGTDSVLDLDDNYTIMAWVNLPEFEAGNHNNILRKQPNYSLKVLDDGAVGFYWYDGISSSWQEFESPAGSVVLNQWHHIAATFTQSRQSIFVNGVEVAVSNVNSTAIINNDPLDFGYSTTGTHNANALVDEIRIYSKALTAANISQIMADTNSCQTLESTLVAEWRFEENEQWNGTANELLDSSGNNLNGVAVNNSGLPGLEFSSPAVGTTDSGTCSYANLSSVSGYFSIADPGADSLLDFPSEHTFSLWVQPKSTPSGINPTIFSKKRQGEINYIATSNIARWWWDTGSSNYSVDTPSGLPIDSWSHLAVTRKNGLQKFYVDGVEVTSATNAGFPEVGNDSLYFGNHQDNLARAFDGYIDEVRLHNRYLSSSQIQSLMNTTRTCTNAILPTTISVIPGSSSASTCSPQEITITLRNSGGGVLTGFTGAVTLSTSTGSGNWAKTATASDANGALTAGAANTGNATYDFVAADNGSVTLTLATTRSETLTVTASETASAVSGTSSNIIYSTNELRAILQSDGNMIVGYPAVYTVEMRSKDPSTGACGVDPNFQGAGIKAWIIRGGADAGGAAPTLTDTQSSSTVTLPSSEPGTNNFNLTFVNGLAGFTMNFSDVGAFELNFKDDSLSYADVELTDTRPGFNVGPFGYYVSVQGNPGATTGAGAVLATAGSNFTVSVTAVGWQAADDLDDNKIPDGHDAPGQTSRADLSDNPVAPSFGNENPPETITLGANLLAPVGGANPGLADSDATGDGRIIASFAGGTGSTSDVYFDEVGIIEILAEVTDGQYISKSAASTEPSNSYSGAVGRFSAASFTASAGALDAACTSGLDFSYMGQGFSGDFTITPQSQRGSALQNYTGDFQKLGLGDFDFYARDINTNLGLNTRLAASANSLTWAGITGTVATSYSIARSTMPDGPYETVKLGVNFTDSDNAGVIPTDLTFDQDNNNTADSIDLGDTEVRFGRLYLADAHGPETSPLPVKFAAQYWLSPNWLTNPDDNCTAIDLAYINYPNGAASTIGNRSVAVGSGVATGTYDSISGGAVVMVAGDAGHSISPPGAGNMGSFTTSVDLEPYPWLQFDWDNDGDYDDSETPGNQINFGSYRGHDRVIFWREY